MDLKLIIRIWIMILFIMTVVTGCTKMDGPEAAAKTVFMEWARRTPYKNETFQTVYNNGTSATVRITAEFLTDSDWKKKKVDLECEQVENIWQCKTWMQFN
jgi:hypothetical protein